MEANSRRPMMFGGGFVILAVVALLLTFGFPNFAAGDSAEPDSTPTPTAAPTVDVDSEDASPAETETDAPADDPSSESSDDGSEPDDSDDVTPEPSGDDETTDSSQVSSGQTSDSSGEANSACDASAVVRQALLAQGLWSDDFVIGDENFDLSLPGAKDAGAGSFSSEPLTSKRAYLDFIGGDTDASRAAFGRLIEDMSDAEAARMLQGMGVVPTQYLVEVEYHDNTLLEGGQVQPAGNVRHGQVGEIVFHFVNSDCKLVTDAGTRGACSNPQGSMPRVTEPRPEPEPEPDEPRRTTPPEPTPPETTTPSEAPSPSPSPSASPSPSPSASPSPSPSPSGKDHSDSPVQEDAEDEREREVETEIPSTPPHDECPDKPGNQPPGASCQLPDACPNIEGHQEPGADCQPPDACPNIADWQPPGTTCVDPLDDESEIPDEPSPPPSDEATVPAAPQPTSSPSPGAEPTNNPTTPPEDGSDQPSWCADDPEHVACVSSAGINLPMSDWRIWLLGLLLGFILASALGLNKHNKKNRVSRAG